MESRVGREGAGRALPAVAPPPAACRCAAGRRRLDPQYAPLAPRHPAADLYATARQYRLLQHRGGDTLQLRYEDAMSHFNATWTQVLQRFWPQVGLGQGSAGCRTQIPACLPAPPPACPAALRLPSSPRRVLHPHAACTPPRTMQLHSLQDAELMLRKAQRCDSSTWDRARLVSNDHVTGAKRPPGDKERLQRALAARPDIRRHLCLLTHAMGYTSQHC